MRKVIFLQSKFPEDDSEFMYLFKRWEEYGETLGQYCKEAVILLFSTNFQQGQRAQFLKSQNIKFLRSVESNVNARARVLALNREIHQSSSSFTLVCGDNQKSLLIAIYLKLTIGSKVRVQIQFHGDTYSFRFNRGLRGLVRVCLSRIGIVFSDSIRIVSKFQMEEIKAFAPKSHQKFVLAPIPIEYSRVAVARSAKTIDLAFIGRLHKERGITELVEIITLIKEVSPEMRIVIAGDGPLRTEIEKQLSDWIEKGDLLMPGYLSGEQIFDLYANTKVLISTAPQEGYGLTLREAALSNVLVVARNSKGAFEAQSTYPDQIRTFSSLSEAVSLIQGSLKHNIDAAPDRLDAQRQIDKEGLSRLVHSWLDN
jgi:glycosyltransferase involved in cell wall biosynthesis